MIGDLDVGPSPSKEMAVSPAVPFAKHTSLPNCCVKYVCGSGHLYECPYNWFGCFDLYKVFACCRMLKGVSLDIERFAIFDAYGRWVCSV